MEGAGLIYFGTLGQMKAVHSPFQSPSEKREKITGWNQLPTQKNIEWLFFKIEQFRQERGWGGFLSPFSQKYLEDLFLARKKITVGSAKWESPFLRKKPPLKFFPAFKRKILNLQMF